MLGGQILPCPRQGKSFWEGLGGPRGGAHPLWLCPQLAHPSHSGPGPAQAGAAVPDPGGVLQWRSAAPRRLRGALPQVSLAQGAVPGGGVKHVSESGWAWGCRQATPGQGAAGETRLPPSPSRTVRCSRSRGPPRSALSLGGLHPAEGRTRCSHLHYPPPASPPWQGAGRTSGVVEWDSALES